MQVLVAQKKQEAEDIASFELVSVDRDLPAFTAGSHIDVHLPGNLIRQYSLCNPPSERQRYIISVLREPSSRGGSLAMHEKIQEGDTLTISEPRNNFSLSEDATRSLLFAGGIGVTPIICMAERLAAIEADFEMHYCTRSLDRTAFRRRIGAAPYASKVVHHLDDGAAEQQLDIATLLAEPRQGTHLYVCGPKGFMDVVLGAARNSGWPDDQIHYEFFAADVIQQEGDEEFEVELAKSGRVVKVRADQSVVGALVTAGIEVPVSCEQGVCGTCLTKVLDGQPDHRDSFLMPDEQAANDCFTPCCSRSKTPRLVLDL